jgi:hypothetical protein
VAGSCDNCNETSWSRKGRNFSAGQELCFVVMFVCARFFQNSSVQTIVVYLHILSDETGSFQIPNWSSCFTVVVMHVAFETVSLRKLYQ